MMTRKNVRPFRSFRSISIALLIALQTPTFGQAPPIDALVLEYYDKLDRDHTNTELQLVAKAIQRSGAPRKDGSLAPIQARGLVRSVYAGFYYGEWVDGWEHKLADCEVADF